MSRCLTGAALALLVLICFSPVLRNGFVGYDDPDYVTANPHVNTGLSAENMRWAFTAAHSSNWHPLTWISHALDCSIWGLNPFGHHLTNLLLHAANTLLVFLWLSRITGSRWRSAFVALVFGLHPLHVESVAWVSERKDVLSTFFGLLALISYPRRMLATTLFFAASLLSKPMLVTLPLLLLLIDRWPLKRPILLKEKLPLFALSALSAIVTVWAQRQAGSVASISGLPLDARLSNATLSYVRYLAQTLWPVKLAPFYPFPDRIAIWSVAACALAIAALTVAAWLARRSYPWLTGGWLWYLIALVPVIGIVQVGMQAMADRYMYVPLIGLAIAAAWSFTGRVAVIAGAAVVAACAILSMRQISVWHDGVSLWAHAIANTSANFVAHDNLGVELDRLGRHDEAIDQYRETLRIKPGDRRGRSNLAHALLDRGERFSQAKDGPHAIAAYREAAQLDPTSAKAHMGLAVALSWSGDAAAARKEFEQTLRYDPANAEAHFDLGMVRASLDDLRGALASFDEAIRFKPDLASAHVARVEALVSMGRYDDAWRAIPAARAANAPLDPRLVQALAARAKR